MSLKLLKQSGIIGLYVQDQLYSIISPTDAGFDDRFFMRIVDDTIPPLDEKRSLLHNILHTLFVCVYPPYWVTHGKKLWEGRLFSLDRTKKTRKQISFNTGLIHDLGHLGAMGAELRVNFYPNHRGDIRLYIYSEGRETIKTQFRYQKEE